MIKSRHRFSMTILSAKAFQRLSTTLLLPAAFLALLPSVFSILLTSYVQRPSARILLISCYHLAWTTYFFEPPVYSFRIFLIIIAHLPSTFALT